MKRLTVFALVLLAVTPLLGAATIHNDDSCDVATLPAATLLLPYFEVDLDDINGETTLFTITNVTNLDRIARVTLWTDYAYPVIAFNIYLTGYDVQAISLFDVIQRGIIAPPSGTGTAVTKRGLFSDPNVDIDLTGCGRLPGTLDPAYVTRMRAAFTLGRVPALGTANPACETAGGQHDNAVGYATIDVVRTCSAHLPTDPRYWTEDIAFDNVLMGDYQQVNSAQNFAQSNPLVHIRAVPEGGSPAQRRLRPQDFDAGFPRTFYARYQAAGTPGLDGRQPLPSTFAARWIQGSASAFQTAYKIWREGRTNGRSCANADSEATLPFVEIVRFDEAENAVTYVPFRGDPPIEIIHALPPASMTGVDDNYIYPQLTNGAVAGWMYLNLEKCGLACGDPAPASQNWVVTSMRAQGRFSTDMDATPLGNGCSPRTRPSEVSTGNVVIGPAANVNP